MGYSYCWCSFLWWCESPSLLLCSELTPTLIIEIVWLTWCDFRSLSNSFLSPRLSCSYLPRRSSNMRLYSLFRLTCVKWVVFCVLVLVFARVYGRARASLPFSHQPWPHPQPYPKDA